MPAVARVLLNRHHLIVADPVIFATSYRSRLINADASDVDRTNFHRRVADAIPTVVKGWYRGSATRLRRNCRARGQMESGAKRIPAARPGFS